MGQKKTISKFEGVGEAAPRTTPDLLVRERSEEASESRIREMDVLGCPSATASALGR